ncbi:Rpn family recombination-promoting nuclease/putative transposase [Phascolarctobacterium sp.]|uniref:Rpn family recombination-promoting nuclease/putative transposase n=1 Tax=Phascolarctobacterium sp. TaxID=2049039 RepID=UPI0038678771
MSEKDIAEKALVKQNDIFADIANALLFQGEQHIQPEDLVDAPTTYMYDADSTVHEQERDVAKLWKNHDVVLSLIGVENQTNICNDMPLRIIGYDGAAYRTQLLNKKVLSRTEKRYPVISIVLYSGKKRWKSNRSLKECLKVPPILEPFVNDYKVNVFELAHLTEEQIKFFQSEYRIIAYNYTHDSVKGNEELLNIPIKHRYETFKLLSIVNKNEQYINFAEEDLGGETNMCDFYEYAESKGKIAGRTEATNSFAIDMIKDGISAKMIQKYTKLSMERLEEIAKSLNTTLVL